MFHVVCLETGEPIRGEDEQVLVWLDGGAAAANARLYSDLTGKKHQPRPIKSDEWKARERGRFERGEYLFLPWADQPWWRGSIGEVEHFAHVSTERDGMVAFTEDAAKGAADRQTRVKPGVYLTRYYEHILGQGVITELARDFAGKYETHEVLFATTPDDIEHVYTRGPSSCMSAGGGDYDSGIHPARVYGAGDLAVAYLRDGDDITARALCWPEKKVWGRSYGDSWRLDAALKTAGYTQGGWGTCFIGARMLRITDGDHFVCPYIDGCPGVEDDGKYLRIGGELESDSTCGLISMRGSGQWCPRCEDHQDEGDFHYLQDTGEAWCNDCTDNHAYYAEDTGRYYADEDSVVRIEGRGYYTTRWFELYGGTCEATDENHFAEDLIHVADVAETWSRRYHDANGFTCEDCGEAFSNAVRGARRNCCADCSGEAPLRDARGRYRARQGRDEHPDQIEISDHVPF